MPAEQRFAPATNLLKRPTVRAIAVAVLVGLALGALGPFGSYLNGGPLSRSAYWVGAILAGFVLYGFALRLADRVAPHGTWFRWPAVALAILVASVPEAALTRFGAFWLWPELAGFGITWTAWYIQTVTLGIILSAFSSLALRSRPAKPPDTAAEPEAKADLIPGNVLALQMEDHYVRVHTQHGTRMILMPLGRAITAVRVEGMRVHRSWWVARHAVASIEGTPRAMRLHLSNGVTAPVARSAVAHLKAAGWLEARDRAV